MAAGQAGLIWFWLRRAAIILGHAEPRRTFYAAAERVRAKIGREHTTAYFGPERRAFRANPESVILTATASPDPIKLGSDL